MNILFICKYIPYPYYYNGNTIRVFHFAKHLSKRHNLSIYCEEMDPLRIEGIRQTGFFDVDCYSRPSSPLLGKLEKKLYSNIRRRIMRRDVIKRLIKSRSIQIVINYIEDDMLYFQGLVNIFDLTDCRILTAERARVTSEESRTSKVIKEQNALIRRSDKILMISRKDMDSALRYYPSAEKKILLVPNGISDDCLSYKPMSSQGNKKRAYAFWGNLSFPPNREAVKWFYNNVFLDSYANSDVVWHIIGTGDDPFCQYIAKLHQNINLAGFVEDLQGFLKKVPVMINPMFQGAGVKNKVLEAMCFGMVIVSTPMGVEGIPGIKANKSFLCPITTDDWHCMINSALNRSNDAIESMILINYQIVRDNYSWQSIVQELEEQLLR